MSINLGIGNFVKVFGEIIIRNCLPFITHKRSTRPKQKLANLTLTLTHDKKGYIGDKFDVKGLPNLYVIGKQGKVILHNVGYGKDAVPRIVDALNKALAG